MAARVEEVWSEVLDLVSEHINTPSFKVWFEGTQPVNLADSQLEISVPNSFAKEYIESRFRPLLEEALGSVLDRDDSRLIVSISGQRGPAPRGQRYRHGGCRVRNERPHAGTIQGTIHLRQLRLSGRETGSPTPRRWPWPRSPGVVYNPTLYLWGGRTR